MFWTKCIVFSIIFTGFVNSEKFAYVSVLSSNDFLLPAQVLAHRLKMLNDSIPYIIIVTQDINNDSISALQNQGVQIQHDLKIDTPYLKTHRARKYQYTKIRLWQMTEFDVIAHLDLDVLPLENISSIFHCGDFCASFRHSDMFNSGVFVLKPNIEVFKDMEKHVQSMISYDGGDQGFLNTYFSDLKYSGMFNEYNLTRRCENDKMSRLSAAFNYDIGMYYLNGGRFLVEPKIIHYTMGPTKPWFWWTYPVFDLNHYWFTARLELDSEIGDNYLINCLRLVTFNVLFIAGFYAQKKVLEFIAADNMINENPSKFEKLAFCHFIYLFIIWFNFQITPNYAYPIPTWIFFSSNVAWMTTILISTYTQIRFGNQPSIFLFAGCILLINLSHLMFYVTAAINPYFGKRALFGIAYLIIQHFIVSSYIRRFLIEKTRGKHVRYHRIPISRLE
ncbi:unnamed protein product [Caenorhabditis angaria]|uniref:Uncharacterized protein n=1 Tax=Caenorhabditis angaria TaxID=860376 RepID=A0A9P1IZU0_9PELO|nr:unnamed protein product [Caenorhabditis angaria]